MALVLEVPAHGHSEQGARMDCSEMTATRKVHGPPHGDRSSSTHASSLKQRGLEDGCVPRLDSSDFTAESNTERR